MKKIISLILAAITIVLEALPFGVALVFALGPDKTSTKTYSYFNLTPYGYANVGPFFTAILTVLLLIMLIIYFFKSKSITAIRIISLVAVFTSALPVIMFGIRYFTIVGGFITASLIAICILSFVTTKTDK